MCVCSGVLGEEREEARAEETKAAGGCLRIILGVRGVGGISALSQLIFWKFTCFI